MVRIPNRKPSCCVADQFCDAPANLSQVDLPSRLPTCFSCGLHVCKSCSSVREYYNYGRKRLCNNCQVELDGNEVHIINRLKTMAGEVQPKKEKGTTKAAATYHRRRQTQPKIASRTKWNVYQFDGKHIVRKGNVWARTKSSALRIAWIKVKAKTGRLKLQILVHSVKNDPYIK